MFKSEGLIYVRHEHLTGVSAKSGKDYEICNITLGDGVESFKLNYKNTLLPILEEFKRGDSVVATLGVIDRFNNTEMIVTGIKQEVY